MIQLDGRKRSQLGDIGYDLVELSLLDKDTTGTNATALRATLELTAVRDRDLNREVGQDWLAVDREVSQRLDQSEKHRKRLNSAWV